MGIGFFWIFGALTAHIKHKKSSLFTILQKNALAFVIVLYYAINKTGFALSIHAFVTSNSLKNNILSIFFNTVIYFWFLYKFSFFAGVFLLLLYLKLTTAIIFKPLLLAVLCFWIIPRKGFKAKAHKGVTLIVILLVTFNIKNSSVSKICTAGVQIYTSLWGFFFSEKTQKTTTVFKNFFLAKPQPFWSGVISFEQKRHTFSKQNLLIYKK